MLPRLRESFDFAYGAGILRAPRSVIGVATFSNHPRSAREDRKLFTAAGLCPIGPTPNCVNRFFMMGQRFEFVDMSRTFALEITEPPGLMDRHSPTLSPETFQFLSFAAQYP